MRKLLVALALAAAAFSAQDKGHAAGALAGCFHHNGAGWRFVVCLKQYGWVGFTGSAHWTGTLPGALGYRLQGGDGLARSSNPAPVIGIYGPAADTVDYELTIGYPENRFLLFYARTCVPNCAEGAGNFVLFSGWSPSSSAWSIRVDRGG